MLDADHRYLGVLTAHEIMDAVASGEVTDVGSLCSPVEPATPTTSLAVVLRQLDRGADAVPVANEDGILVGLGPAQRRAGRPQQRGVRGAVQR